ncbi:MAG: O-antigen ligase family protein [Bacilli bacterium]|nr:O-antigen ligase family protein [Bacilli bacterium]
MSKTRFTLTAVVFWAIISLTCFLNENIAPLLYTDMKNGFDPLSFGLVSVLILILIIFYFIVERKKNGEKIKIFPLILALFFGFSVFLGIWNAPDSITFSNVSEVTITITPYMKTVAIIEALISIVVIYIFFNPRKKSVVSQKMTYWIAYCFAFVMLIYLVTSFFVEKDVYLNILLNKSNTGVGSIVMMNPNIYSAGFLVAILMLIVVDHRKSAWYNTVLIIILLIGNLFTGCTSVMFILTAAVCLYFIYRIIYGYAHKKVLKTTLFIVFVVEIVGILVLAFAICLRNNVPFVINLHSFIQKTYSLESIGSFSNRTNIWNCVWTLLNENPFYLAFGRGHMVSKEIMKGYSLSLMGPNPTVAPFVSAHSTFFDILLRYGIVGAIFYYGFMLYFLICIIYLLFKKKAADSFIYLLAFACITAHGVVETDIFMNVETKDLLMSMVIFYPPIYMAYHLRHPEIVNSVKETNDEIILSNDTMRTIRKLIVSIIVGVVIALSSLLLTKEGMSYIGSPRMLCIGLCFIPLVLFLPGIIATYHSKNKGLRFIPSLIIFGLITVLIFGSLTALCYFNRTCRLYYKYILPGALFIYLAFIWLFTVPTHKYVRGSTADLFKGMFYFDLLPLIIVLPTSILVTYLLANNYPLQPLHFILLGGMWMVLYLIILFVSNRKEMNVIYTNNNIRRNLRFKKFILSEENHK